jgi:hypothetical protein
MRLKIGFGVETPKQRQPLSNEPNLQRSVGLRLFRGCSPPNHNQMIAKPILSLWGLRED